METDYECITFSMKKGYSKEDLEEVIGLFKAAFKMSYAEVKPCGNYLRKEGGKEDRKFAIYFKNGEKAK
jgi:hypothetical protein